MRRQCESVVRRELWWGFLILCLLGCDKSTDSTAGSQSYVAYFYDVQSTGNNPLFRYRFPEKVLDSVSFPLIPRQLVLSSGGERFYARPSGGDGVKVVDAKSIQVIGQLPDGQISLSPNGEYVAISGSDLWIFEERSHSLIFHDTDRVFGGRFSVDSKRFWDQGISYLYRVKLGHVSHVDRFEIPDGRTGRAPILFTSDEQFFFFSSPVTGADEFRHYDLASDSICFRMLVSPGGGDLVMTNGGEKVLIGSLGNVDQLPRTFSYVVYHPMNRIADSVLLDYGCTSAQHYVFDPASLTISADSKYMLGLTSYVGAAMIIDIDNDVPADTICIGNPMWLRCAVISDYRSEKGGFS